MTSAVMSSRVLVHGHILASTHYSVTSSVTEYSCRCINRSKSCNSMFSNFTSPNRIFTQAVFFSTAQHGV